MTLRCRAGDLAIYIGSDPIAAGRPCTVLRAAPVGRWFRLPNKRLHAPVDAARWIVDFPRALSMPLRSGNRIVSRYAVAADWSLRPIRPDAEPVDVERGEPVEVA